MLRARTAAAVREFATMRLARMARGASDGYVLKETREYRCPSCQAEVISPAGSVSAMDGLIKSLHRCEVCQLTFFVVRAAIELTMKRETPDSSNP